MAVSDDRIYIADSGGFRDKIKLAIWDAEQPDNPKLIWQLKGDEGLEIAAYENHLLTAGNYKIQIWDVGALPSPPKVVGEINATKAISGIALAWPYVYAAEYKLFEIFDFTDTKTPRLIGTCNMDEEGRVLAVTRDYIFKADWGGNKQNNIHAIDIRDPASPRIVASFPMPYAMDVDRLAVSGDHIFAITDKGLYILKFTPPVE